MNGYHAEASSPSSSISMLAILRLATLSPENTTLTLFHSDKHLALKCNLGYYQKLNSQSSCTESEHGTVRGWMLDG